MDRNVVIIGGGVAGVTAGEELRKKNQEINITIVEREANPLYSRVLLPHYLHGKIDREKVFIKKPEWYQEHNIEYINETEVLKIDPENQHIELSTGQELPYSELIIATGGEVRMLPFDANGVHFLRTLSDADGILARIQQIESRGLEKTAIIYGGGFIAIEFVNALFAHGFKVKLAMRGSGFWSKQLSPEMSSLLEKELSEKGVELNKNVQEIDIEAPSGELETVIIDGEKHESHFLGVGIGIIPEFELLKSAGIEIAHGVLADRFHRTNIKNIYAVGDIAEFEDITVDRHIMTGNWLSAISQGRSVASQILDEEKPYELVTSYASKLLDLTFVSIGDISKDHADNIETRLTEKGGIQLFERSGRTVGAIMIGDTGERMAITESIKQKQKYEIEA